MRRSRSRIVGFALSRQRCELAGFPGPVRSGEQPFGRSSVSGCRPCEHTRVQADATRSYQRAECSNARPQASAFAATAFPALECAFRSRNPLIHCPIATTFAKSIPVSIPRPFSRYSTSSVATLPVAPLAYGHPPSPAMLVSKVAMPSLEAGVHVRGGHAVRVVEMPAHGRQVVHAQGRFHRPLGLLGRADADRVGHADVVDADVLHPARDVLHRLGLHFALVRAARARRRSRRARACRAGARPRTRAGSARPIRRSSS